MTFPQRRGLEFESVFFVNLDQISKKAAGLLDKYLYVGLTRAASFLGGTYTTDFPKEIHFMRDDFQEGDWSSFVGSVSSFHV
jgi:hypothetical protein